MTIKHYTKNRQLIMRLLSETWDDCGLPPYSASSLHYIIETIAHYGDAECKADYGITKPQSMRQIHRTLNDLEKSGLLVSKHLEEPSRPHAQVANAKGLVLVWLTC